MKQNLTHIEHPTHTHKFLYSFLLSVIFTLTFGLAFRFSSILFIIFILSFSISLFISESFKVMTKKMVSYTVLFSESERYFITHKHLLLFLGVYFTFLCLYPMVLMNIMNQLFTQIFVLSIILLWVFITFISFMKHTLDITDKGIIMNNKVFIPWHEIIGYIVRHDLIYIKLNTHFQYVKFPFTQKLESIIKRYSKKLPHDNYNSKKIMAIFMIAFILVMPFLALHELFRLNYSLELTKTSINLIDEGVFQNGIYACEKVYYFESLCYMHLLDRYIETGKPITDEICSRLIDDSPIYLSNQKYLQSISEYKERCLRVKMPFE